MTTQPDTSIVRAMITDAFKSNRMDPSYGLAVAQKESGFNPDAVATDPRDLARGGSFGLFQMSMKTAEGLKVPGYGPEKLTKAPEKLTKEALCVPAVNILFCIALTRANMDFIRRLGPFNLGPYLNLMPWCDDLVRNLAAMHNSGHRYTPRLSKEARAYADDVLVRVKKFRTAVVM